MRKIYILILLLISAILIGCENQQDDILQPEESQMQDGEFELGLTRWGPDYADPMTFLDLLTSTSALNNSGFSNSEYDSIIKEAKQETNVVKREELLHKAEDILMEDMSVIPLYYYTQVKGIKPYVKGIRVTQLGFIYFDKAYIDGK